MATTEATTQTKRDVVYSPEALADDDRGVIEQLDDGTTNSVLRITSKKGSVRANHYHQHDSHICYLVSGKIRYVERDLKQQGNEYVYDESMPLREYTIEPGQLFYTAPRIAHAMEFVEDSEFLAITPRSGNQEEYEDDVVRVTLVDPAEAAARAAKS